MLQTNRLKAALKENKPVFGLLNSIPSPLVVEMIGYAGYDFVILDMEHVGVNPETLENMIRVAECAGITPLVGCLPQRQIASCEYWIAAHKGLWCHTLAIVPRPNRP